MVRTDTPAKALTFADLARLEPGLSDLERDVRRERRERGRPYCANRVWYGLYKPRLVWLVGWHADTPHPELRTPTAYATAYRHLYELLPDCRRCACPTLADLM
jgi:hypothetical protein